jgi:hypothetical protein
MVSRRTSAWKLNLNHFHLHVKNLKRAQWFYESYFRFVLLAPALCGNYRTA